MEIKEELKNLKVDDVVYVRSHSYKEWSPRYFAEIKNGRIFVWNDGHSSYSAAFLYVIDNSELIGWWEQVKLPSGAIINQ